VLRSRSDACAREQPREYRKGGRYSARRGESTLSVADAACSPPRSSRSLGDTHACRLVASMKAPHAVLHGAVAYICSTHIPIRPTSAAT